MLIITYSGAEHPNKRRLVEFPFPAHTQGTHRELCNQLTEPFTHTPMAAEMDNLLCTPLQASLPYVYDIPREILAEHPYIIPLYPSVDIFRVVSTHVSTVLMDRPIFYGNFSEDSYHALWDDIIMQTLFLFSKQIPGASLCLEYQRNSIDKHSTATTCKKSRPDFLCWMRGALILRGEEKAEQKDLRTAYTELSDKFGVWSPIFYGELPFLFGYATGGTLIEYVFPPSDWYSPTYSYSTRFCLITRNGQCLRLDNHCFDAANPSHRISIMRTTINILRCLRTFQPLLPNNPVQLMHDYSWPGGVKVSHLKLYFSLLSVLLITYSRLPFTQPRCGSRSYHPK